MWYNIINNILQFKKIREESEKMINHQASE